MNPKQDQVAEAQRAGDVAYAAALEHGGNPPECYDVYRAAYDAVRDEQEHSKRGVMVQHATGAVEIETTWAELTDDDIALMEARSSETANETPEYEGMWK